MEKKQKTWSEMTMRINAVSQTVRTADDLRKKWNDWSSVTKGKAAKRKQSPNKTGSGQPDTKPLTEIEELVVSILGETAVSGFKGGIDTARVAEEEDFSGGEGECDSSPYNKAKPEHEFPTASGPSSSGMDLVCREAPNCLDNIECASKPMKTVPLKKRKLAAAESVASSYENDVISIEREKLNIETARLEIEEKRLDIEQQRLQIEQQRLQVESDILNTLLSQRRYSDQTASQLPGQYPGLERHIAGIEQYSSTLK
ncbi:MSD4-like protein [Mya arenaria]|uniref:MSD4-like protein n=1 Tax=Mya arenaria TaxID=6604 RepID=A0ABY7E3W6_MYAAR|nr:MSD4-like protein [Mya arenaria]